MNIMQRSLSEIVTAVPGAAGLLRTFNLNFCTQGDIILQQAINDNGLDNNRVKQQLDLLLADKHLVDWNSCSVRDMITHILNRFHNRHREQLPYLIQLAVKVERVHGESSFCPHGFSDLLRDVKHDLENHMQKEEQILFPMLAGGMYPKGPIDVMQNEHDEHLKVINEINILTNGMIVPEGACDTWIRLYAGMREFTDDLMEHITIENYFLFMPREDNNK